MPSRRSLIFAVVAQSFAVIGYDEDDGAIVDAFRFQEREQLADDGVPSWTIGEIRAGDPRVEWINKV